MCKENEINNQCKILKEKLFKVHLVMDANGKQGAMKLLGEKIVVVTTSTLLWAVLSSSLKTVLERHQNCSGLFHWI